MKKNIKSNLVTKNRRILTIAGAFLLLWIVATIVFYSRFPFSFVYPNFYAEDGSVFLRTYLDEGLLRSLFSPFNGYFVSGIYAAVALGDVINRIFLDGSMLSLPKAFSLASFIILGFAVALCLVLRKILGLGATIIVAALVLTFPIINTTHQVIGTIGNLKWIFFFIAYLIAVYWIANRRKMSTASLILSTIGIVTCLYTNAYSYLALAIIGFAYTLDVARPPLSSKDQLSKRVRVLLQNKAFLFFFATVFISVIQLIFVKIHGIPKMAGYLDTPFPPSEFIEVVIGRTVLFSGLYPVWSHLTDGIIVALFIALLGCGAWLLRGLSRYIFFASIAAAIGATIMFISTRPGVGSLFNSYSSTGADHFFYAQNLIMFVPFALIVIGLTQKFAPGKYRLQQEICVAILTILVVINVTGPNFISHNNIMESTTGTFAQNVRSQCAKNQHGDIDVPLYPIGAPFKMSFDESICDNSDEIKITALPLNAQVNNSDVLLLQPTPAFYQTFTAKDNGLDGIRVMLSTYGAKMIGNDYKLMLMDGSCKNILRVAPVGRELFDNQLYNIHFDLIATSKNERFCFTILKTDPRDPNIALREFMTDAYKDGELNVNMNKEDIDLVFYPLYSENR